MKYQAIFYKKKWCILYCLLIPLVEFCWPSTYLIKDIAADKVLFSAELGPVVQNLTMSLVNDLLKFSSSDTQIRWNFLLKKYE